MSHRHDRLRVLHAPMHGPTVTHRDIRYALSSEFSACAVTFSEAYRHEAFLRDRPRWRPTMPVPQESDDWHRTRGKFDAPVLVRRHHPLVASWSQHVCRRSVPVRIAPPRWFNGQTFAHDFGAVEVIAAHPNAAVVGRPPGLDRVEQYAQSMQALEVHIARSVMRGRLIVVGGDLNWPGKPAHPSWSPPAMFRRLGFETWSVGIDWLAWSPALVPTDRRIIPRGRNGQDHPWLWMSWRHRED